VTTAGLRLRGRASAAGRRRSQDRSRADRRRTLLGETGFWLVVGLWQSLTQLLRLRRASRSPSESDGRRPHCL